MNAPQQRSVHGLEEWLKLCFSAEVVLLKHGCRNDGLRTRCRGVSQLELHRDCLDGLIGSGPSLTQRETKADIQDNISLTCGPEFKSQPKPCP
eukprot:1355419-Rhodomonas_salina.2